MSKGLGRVERQVIELLAKQPGLKGSEVVTAIAGNISTSSEKFAIRRALASLQGKGFLDKTSGPDGPRWARSEPGPADVDPLVLAIHQCEERLLAVARAKMVLREREAQLAACMASLRPKIEAAGRDYFEFCKGALGRTGQPSSDYSERQAHNIHSPATFAKSIPPISSGPICLGVKT